MDQSAEIICVGTELLLGDILNSNAQYLAQQLAQLGIPHYYQTVVGDNPNRIQRAIAIACERSRLLIFTGGLGPTPDDLTTETLADFFGEPLIERPEIIADLHQKFTQRGRNLSPSNLKQALLPETAQTLPNPLGSAPGIIWEPRSGLTILTFPGVPKEMVAMWEQTAVPYLKQHGWSKTTIYSRILRHWGIGEATLADKIRPFFDCDNPTVAPYAGEGEVRLRLSAKATSEVEAQALIAPVEQELRDIIGEDCYGADTDSLSSVVGQQLIVRNETLAVAESCTAGGLGHQITTTPGSSAYFLGGVISYSNAIKIQLLNVQDLDLTQYGAVSHPVARQMALGVRDRLGSSWGLSITGIAGPEGGTEEKPVGLVYIGIAGPDNHLSSNEYRLSTYRGREWIRWLSICTALDQLRRLLNTKLK
ncbi:MAG: competence/damage-inducible protein A [Cyanobacteria bacterium P01_F01_bin.150]